MACSGRGDAGGGKCTLYDECGQRQQWRSPWQPLVHQHPRVVREQFEPAISNPVAGWFPVEPMRRPPVPR